ncbi:MAG: pilus assembly protein FimV [Desulforhopalus sp.]
MVEQYNENQYDDDLTDGSAEYDDSYYTGAEDLFDYTPDEESPISRLKSLVLSIDWEITDEVLMEFNEELVDLKDIWAGEKINLVYVQALEKLSKYIYQKKADSHPSAIKLLLTLYHNLEKIVSSDDLSEAEKKAILLEDVKRFEDLKTHLKTAATDKVEVDSKQVAAKTVSVQKKVDEESELLRLKAIVLGIDWEITDQDLSALRQEVIRLETLFAGSRPRLILLQGIGTIGAYIKVKKSDSHADAFKVLHLFYGSLEKIVDIPMSIEEEKSILFPAVEKFNQFKALLGETISPASISRSEEHNEEDGPTVLAETITPAFSDFSEDEVMGFQADQEAAALGIDNPDNVNIQVAEFFGEDSFVDEREASMEVNDTLETQFIEAPLDDAEAVDKNVALLGVDVEEGDEDEQVMPKQVEITPALSFEDEVDSDSPVAQVSDFAGDPALTGALDEELSAEDIVEVTFADDGEDEIIADFSGIAKNIALQGVDVESEADDDTEEDALPLLEGKLAPALADNDEVSVYNADTLARIAEPDVLNSEFSDTVLDFFEEEGEDGGEVGAFEDSAVKAPLELDEDLSFAPDTCAIASLSGGVEGKLNEDFSASYDEFDSDNLDSLKSSKVDEQNEDLSLDIDGQLDDFFGNDEIGLPDSLNEMSSSLGFADATEDSSELMQDDAREEEVVFELVEESVVPASVGSIVASIDDSIDEDFSDSETTVSLDNLAICIDAVGLELEDNILNGLLDELNSIDKQWAENPLEKTFLHLLRTITCHIDRYRYEAGSKAYNLLKSVFDALVLSQSSVDQREDLILAQTVRVLDWQQEIIAGDNEKNVDSFVKSEALFVEEPGNSVDQVITFEDDLFGAVENESEVQNSNPGDLKDEISSLRKSLQDEISVLKKGQIDD